MRLQRCCQQCSHPVSFFVQVGPPGSSLDCAQRRARDLSKDQWIQHFLPGFRRKHCALSERPAKQSLGESWEAQVGDARRAAEDRKVREVAVQPVAVAAAIVIPLMACRPVARRPVPRRPIACRPMAHRPISCRPIARRAIARRPMACRPIDHQPLAYRPIARRPIAC